MLRKLGAYPRQNGLAMALRELGRIERTLFTLEWLQSTELRRRVQSGLNKGEAKNALARAVFFNRLGEMRGRSFENQRYRASGLTLGSGRVHSLEYGLFKPRDSGPEAHGLSVGDNLLEHLSPLGWEHASLTGDCVWRHNRRVEAARDFLLAPTFHRRSSKDMDRWSLPSPLVRGRSTSKPRFGAFSGLRTLRRRRASC